MTDHEQPAAGVALKPCPFCGDAKSVDDIFTRDGRKIVCKCGASMIRFQPNASAKAIAAWNTRAPTDAGGAVSEAAIALLREIFPPADLVTYSGEPDDVERIQWVSNGARRRVSALLNGLTPAPQAEGDCFECSAPLVGPFCPECNPAIKQALGYAVEAPQPLQQGGEVTREAVKNALQGSMGWPHDLHPGPAADAILALFASLAADRDKAVGLLRDLKAAFGDPMTRRALGGHNERQMAAILQTSAFLSRQTEGR